MLRQKEKVEQKQNIRETNAEGEKNIQFVTYLQPLYEMGNYLEISFLGDVLKGLICPCLN